MEQKEISGQYDPDQNDQITSPIFFPTTTKKLAIMSICTFGIYEIYWFYRNWKFLKEKRGYNIRPFWRALFSIFFCYSLFKTVKYYANKTGIQETFTPGGLAAAYILIYIAYRLPDPAWLISIFTFIPLLTAQKTINTLNRDQLEKVINKKFSGWNIFGIVAGIIWWGLVIPGMFQIKW